MGGISRNDARLRYHDQYHCGCCEDIQSLCDKGYCLSVLPKAAWVIVGVIRFRGASPEILVLTDMALGSFFTAGTMLLHFFGDDVQLAAMVFSDLP